MWAMLRCSHFVHISIQALQTSSNVNNIMLNESKKREQIFLLYSLKASKHKVAKLHVFEGLDHIQIRRSDILQSYWFLVRPLGPNFLRYATNIQLSQYSVQFMLCIFGHIKEERHF
jgi:hypothetical protein